MKQKNMTRMDTFSLALKNLHDQQRFRSLVLPGGIDFTSNDYLGMANHPDLRQAAVKYLQDGLDIGAGGSRLLRGHTQAHQSLESFSANHFKAPATLFFATGFQANYALLTTLPDRHDIVLYDALVHASMRDGLHATTAQSFKFAHNDLDTLRALLEKYKNKNIWIALESIYSMDGDMAPLTEIYALAAEYNAMLIVDEAHSTGIYGDQGKGLCWPLIEAHGYERLITLHTCGKAMGVAGGLVCAHADVINTLINRARAFIYSTAPMPLQAFLVQKSLEIIAGAEGDKRRNQLARICTYAKELFGSTGTPIIPIILGTDEKALHVAATLQNKGFDIRAIRPPTVPEGTSRLRLSLNANLTPDILQNLHIALIQAIEETTI